MEMRKLLKILIPIIVCGLHGMCGRHISLNPLKDKSATSGGKDALLMVIPESGMMHTDYKVYANIVQRLYPLRLWIGLVDVSHEGKLSLDNLPLLLAECMHELITAGMDIRQTLVFIAAHGHPGHVAADYARAVPESLGGLVLLGTYLPARWSPASFPIPVLTISGELDGIKDIMHLSNAIQNLNKDAKFDPGLITQSPIVILEGANHNAFTEATLPEYLRQQDIKEEDDSFNTIVSSANITAMFLTHTVQEPKRDVIVAKGVFKQAFLNAKNITHPIRAIKEITKNDSKSYWVKSAQKWLSGLEGKQSTQLEVDSYVVLDRGPLALPPTLIKEGGINYAITFSEFIKTKKRSDQDTDDEGLETTAEIAARMLGPEIIQEYLKNTTIAHNYTCRDLNYASFMTAYHKASDRARKRYNSYKRGILFLPDIITDSEALWESTSLKTEITENQLQVTSIAFKTPKDINLEQYSGLFFCKLLPPDRALEWIYVEALRQNISVRNDSL